MNWGDIGQLNGTRLMQIASCAPCNSHVALDIGVRTGISSGILLSGFRGKVIGIDASECPEHLKGHPRYEFHRSDSVTYLAQSNEPIGIAFHDTLHIAEQVMCELYYVWPRLAMGGWCVFHDTHWPKDKHDFYCGREWPQVWQGLSALFFDKQLHIEDSPDSWGMTFIQKNKDVDVRKGIEWDKVFEARNQLLTLLEGIPCNKQILTP